MKLHSLHQFDTVLRIEAVMSRYKRKLFRKWLVFVLLLAAIGAFFLPSYRSLCEGLFLVAFSIYLTLFLLEVFFFSTYTRLKNENARSFMLSSILFESREDDMLTNFAYSNFGSYFLARLGITPDMLKIYIASHPPYAPVPKSRLESNEYDSVVTVTDYVAFLIRSSPTFESFLKSQAVTEKEIRMTGEWIERAYGKRIEKERWWSRDNMARVPGLGKDWAYGQTDKLERYGHFLNSGSSVDLAVFRKEVEILESILVKNRSSNAIVMSPSDTTRLAIVQSLATMIYNGISYPALEHKKIFLLDSLRLSETSQNAADFENDLALILSEAHRVGNIILVIDNLPVFLESAKNLGVDAMAIFVPYLRSVSLQCVALSDTDEYYHKLQTRTDITEHFEIVKVEIKDDGSLIYLIEDQAAGMEGKYKVFYTYQAIEAIAWASAKYFQADVLSTKAVDLTLEVAAHQASSGKYLIGKEDVLALVQTKTGIPVGEITGAEKDKLLNLESLLKERVVGQDEAGTAISQALRRARSGLGKTDRPMGSFIFLGPTGVGKTETTKALGDIFFGPTVPIVRFDMSEYSGTDALPRLIGDSYTHSPGLLATRIRERQYGILLLDEFEKASKEVHNLFLQILDEGYFSDVSGKQVNVRNMIIIATSNAASDIIMATPADELAAKKNEIMDQIISRGIFRPELLNRFDGVIFFHSLSNDNLENVTKLMLGDLTKRLKEKGVELVMTPDLISVLMEKGNDARFGARPMNRAISDLVEEKIAEGLIAGTIQPGSEVRFMKNAEGDLMIENQVTN